MKPLVKGLLSYKRFQDFDVVFFLCAFRMLFVLRPLMKVCALRTQNAAGVKVAVESTSPPTR